uniref:Uncharacterized protein LOC113785385 n=1 Tax=Cicer arietinum TaxID=3827 RepID=A0A3Q7YCH5_CICAR|nr:uncharacterized protein LOC113785385 [Cicer arietinum]
MIKWTYFAEFLIRREPVHEANAEPTDHADDDATHAADGDPADDDDTVEITRRAIQIAEELIGRNLILPDGMSLVNELILMLRSQRGDGRDWTNIVPYRRRNIRT